MKKRGIGKQGIDINIEQLIFILIIIIFTSTLFLFLNRSGTQSNVYEQSYAKQIALFLDKAKPGTNISLDISKLIDASNKNKYIGNIVTIDNNKNQVIVKTIEGKGYSFTFFSNYNVLWSINKDEQRLVLNIVA